MKRLSAVLMAMLCIAVTMQIHAAMFSTSPGILQESSSNVKIYFDPAQSGVAALQNASEIYAHIGVTMESDPSAWAYVKGTWTSNTADKKFTRLSDGRWELNIGDIRKYFGIVANNDRVCSIAIIARNAAGNAQTSDNFIEVMPEGFHTSLSYDRSSLVMNGPTTVTFTASSSLPSDISITVDGRQIASAGGVYDLTGSHTFTQTGTASTVKATITSGGETRTQEVKALVTGQAVAQAYPGGTPRQGAVRNSDGTVTFCLAAPGKSSVMLMGGWNGFQPDASGFMKYHDYNGYRYFWTTTTEQLADNIYYPYYYLVDGTRAVGDPYARLVLDPDDSNIPEGCFADMPQYPARQAQGQMMAVYRGDIDSYSWDSATLNFQTPDTRSLTIYEMLVRDFSGDGSDQNGKRFGTFRSAMKHIPYLKNLGVNAVELMPVMEFNGNNSWGYNTNFYMALDKAYGSPRDMRDFIAECHRQGIAVILDIVFNQSDGKHPWYQMYDRGSNPFYNASAPHAYNVLNDWKQEYPLVEQHWIDVLTYWLDAYKVDGFRFDLVKGLGDTGSYGTPSNSNTDRYNKTRVDRMKRLNEAMRAVKPDVIHINELLGTSQEENEHGANNQMNWSKVTDGAAAYAKGQTNTKAGDTKGFMASQWGRVVGQTVDFAESHDEKRIARNLIESGDASVRYTVLTTGDTKSEAAVKRLGALAAQMLLAPGPKMIWQFGELAADERQGSDLEKLRAMTPRWDDLDNSLRAFLHENYTQLCNLRLKNNDLFTGQAECTLSGFSNDLNTMRWMRVTSGNREIIGVFNPAVSGSARDAVVPVTHLSASNQELITASYGTSPSMSVSGNMARIKLNPHEFAVFATTTVAGIDEIGAGDDTRPTITVRSQGGRIVIDGDYNTAEVYTLQGVRLRGLDVAPGLYIVRVDGHPFKVLAD